MSNFEIMLEILSKTAMIYLGVFTGVIFIKSPLAKYRKLFVNITINIVTTMLVFVSFVKIADFQGNDWIFPIIASLLVTVIGLYAPPLIAKLMKQEKPKPAEICTATFSNALNFPFPIIYALSPQGLGAAGLFLAVNLIMRNTVGLWISGISISRSAIKDVLKFPPIWGIILGIIARIYFQSMLLPIVTFEPVDFAFQVGIFMTLMTVGFSLKIPKKEYLHPYFRVGMVRYVLSLILAIVLIFPFNLQPIIAIPLLVQLIAPPAVYNGLYAERFGLDTELTTQVIVTLTLIALAILPLELWIIHMLFLA
ncbi:MAG: hypothetical protein INQ03_18070 [Candidatus Heimdallarchaeota archaeon]|nr:hypothetical protein [Candidatus Heimdallarchaeota archaeon]